MLPRGQNRYCRPLPLIWQRSPTELPRDVETQVIRELQEEILSLVECLRVELRGPKDKRFTVAPRSLQD